QRQSGFNTRVGFASVSSSDPRHDDANLIFRKPKDLRQLLLNAGRILAGGIDDQLSIGIPEGGSGVGFDMAVLNRRHTVNVFQNLIRYLKSFGDVTVFNVKNTANIAAQLKVMYLRQSRRLDL